MTTGTDAGWLESGAAYQPYAAAIRMGGGDPVRVDRSMIGRERQLVNELDGFLFTGGWDIDLRNYPKPPSLGREGLGARMARGRMRIDFERDRYEIPLAQAAIEADLPVLGICRGCQLITVALGGRLILDVATEVESELRHVAYPPPTGASSGHPLMILPGTHLAAVLPPQQFRHTNSRHHQAVLPDDELPVKIAAVCPVDGVVEAVEVPSRRFAIGVQWHPEHPKDDVVREAHRPLFKALVAACG